MSSKSCKFIAQASENEPDVVLALCFLTFLGTSRANRLLLRPFLDEWRPEMVSKPMDSRETSLKKSKKRQAIAPAAI